MQVHFVDKLFLRRFDLNAINVINRVKSSDSRIFQIDNADTQHPTTEIRNKTLVFIILTLLVALVKYTKVSRGNTDCLQKRENSRDAR